MRHFLPLLSDGQKDKNQPTYIGSLTHQKERRKAALSKLISTIARLSISDALRFPYQILNKPDISKVQFL